MARKTAPPLSRAEMRILSLVWKMRRATVHQVCSTLAGKRRTSYATVQTLLRRLEKKGYLAHELVGKAHVFFPAVEREDVIKTTVSDFVERLFGGDPMPLMLHLAKHRKLTAADVERLTRLLDQNK